MHVNGFKQMNKQLLDDLGCQEELILFLSGCTKHSMHLPNDPNMYYLVQPNNMEKLIESIIEECALVTNYDVEKLKLHFSKPFND